MRAARLFAPSRSLHEKQCSFARSLSSFTDTVLMQSGLHLSMLHTRKCAVHEELCAEPHTAELRGLGKGVDESGRLAAYGQLRFERHSDVPLTTDSNWRYLVVADLWGVHILDFLPRPSRAGGRRQASKPRDKAVGKQRAVRPL